MVNKEEVYQAFGELIYAVAMADGEVQKEEVDKLHEILSKHEWANEIKWSFDYESKQKTSLNDAYNKALDTMVEYGPFEDYPFLFKTMEEVAEAFDGVVVEERALIDKFKNELINKFKEDNRFSGY